MKRNLFYFAWREFTRSAVLNKNMATKGILIFLVLYLSLVALYLGFNLTGILEKSEPENIISAFNAIVFTYLGADLVLRIMIQNLPTFGFQPFLLLPVKRGRIARYMLNKSVLHFFNILPLFLVLPFLFKTAVLELKGVSLVAWVASLYLMVLVNHFVAIYLKWRTNESNILFYAFLAVAAGVVAIDYFRIADVNAGLGKLFDLVVEFPAAVLIFPVLLFSVYILNLKYLLSRFFVDELSQKKKDGSTHDFSWLTRVGEYGKMLSLEIKMIVRNKRPKNTALMSLLFIFYGLIIYRDYDAGAPEFILVLGGMFMTGVFGMMYGQFFPAWHSRYYPLLMAQNVKMKQILQSAYFLMAVTNVVFYLLSLGYMFIAPKVWYIHFVVMLYNIGVNSWVLLALGLNSRKSIDLDQKAMFNYQGMSATNWLITFPVLFGPLILYGLLAWAFGNVTAYVVLAVLGILGIVFHPRLLDYFTKGYLKRKHRMIAGYKAS